MNKFWFPLALLVPVVLLYFHISKDERKAEEKKKTMSPPVIIPARQTASAAVIFLHGIQSLISGRDIILGLGDSGHGWSEVGRMFAPQLPNVKFIFPHAYPAFSSNRIISLVQIVR